MATKNRQGFLLALCIGWVSLQLCIAQETKTLLIEKGQEYVLNNGHLEVDTLIVRGVFKVADTKDVSLKFKHMVIEGGEFQAGTKAAPFKHRLLLMMASKESAITIINEGNFSLFGTSSLIAKPAVDGFEKDPVSDINQQNIILTSELDFSGNLSINNGGSISISGVLFDGLGTELQPAVAIENQSNTNAFLKNCRFTASNNLDVQLLESNFIIEKNVLVSKSGSSICSKNSGKPTSTIIRNNTIYNTSNKGTFAVVLKGFAHTFTNNHVEVEAHSHGVGIFENEEKIEATDGRKLNLHHNKITNTTEHQHQSIGLSIGNCSSKKLITSTGNTIQGFETGAIFRASNFVASDYHFKHNKTGCVPGTAYLEDCLFEANLQISEATNRAFWVTDTYSKSAPKIKNIKIIDHKVGFHFEGVISKANFFKQIQYENTNPISYSNLHKASVIHDADGTLIGQKREVALHKNSKHRNHQHHSHHPRKTENQDGAGHILYATNSFFKNDASNPVSNTNGLLYSKRANLGTLTIATGMGLTDPVHEHDGVFNGISCRNKVGGVKHLNGISNKYVLEVIAEEWYELDFGEQTLPFFDLGFEWEAPSGKSAFLKVPYPHSNPIGLRSFGNLLAAVGSMDALKESNTSTYYWDKDKELVFLKMVAQENFEEMVIYSSSVLTEITVDGDKVPIAIKADKKRNDVTFKYVLPNLQSYSKLEVLDYYGNVVELLYDGHLKKETNIVSINLENYDFQNNVYRYALTVDEVVHRGPVHPY